MYISNCNGVECEVPWLHGTEHCLFFYVFDVTGVDEDTRPAKTVCDEIKAHALSLAIDRQHQPLKCIEVYICLTRVYIEDV